MPSAEHEISTPRSSATPVSPPAAAASSQPAKVSWSVRPTMDRPASRAARISWAGASVPSEQDEWVCGSMRVILRG